MDKTLQDLAWSVLPKEFKEEVKKEWELTDNIERLPHDAFLRGKCQMMRDLFGRHNLNSDAERDEMLTVSRKRVQELYNRFEHAFDNVVSDNLMGHYRAKIGLLRALFGSKCLADETCNVASSNVGSNVARSELRPTEEDDPDLAQRLAFLNSLSNEHSEPKPAEPKYHRGEKVCYNGYVYEIEGIVSKNRYALKGLNFDLDEDMIEPYIKPEENIAGNRNLSQDCDKEFDNILKNSFSKERRLNVAAMAMQGILSNESRMKQYEAMAASKPYEKLTDVVARNALRYADAIMNQAGE